VEKSFRKEVEQKIKVTHEYSGVSSSSFLFSENTVLAMLPPTLYIGFFSHPFEVSAGVIMDIAKSSPTKRNKANDFMTVYEQRCILNFHLN
jgi:hypothetical protein